MFFHSAHVCCKIDNDFQKKRSGITPVKTGRFKPSSNYTGSETAANLNSSNAKSVTVTAKWKSNDPCQDENGGCFDYTGTVHTFTAKQTGYYQIELWGATGGDGYGGYSGGNGAYVRGTLNISKSTKLYVYVGQMGNNGVSTKDNTADSRTFGGWNGGGGNMSYAECMMSSSSGTGGGETDIRTDNENVSTRGKVKQTSDASLRKRIMVASGGGGGYNDFGYDGITGVGGVGAGINVLTIYSNHSSVSSNPVTSGSQTTGGTSSDSPSSVAGFGYGATSGCRHWGGGGGGWYGGGSGGGHTGPGAGGSSYISGHLGSVAVTSLSSTSPKCSSGTSISCSVSPTGYQFVEGTTQMIAGNASMPNPRGSGNITGNNGNGYARITYLGTSI